VLYERPVRELFVDAVLAMPTPFRRADVVAWFAAGYPSVRRGTVEAHITAATVNSRSRHHYGAADQHLIFQRDDGSLERYDSSRHGKWDPHGALVPGSSLTVVKATPGSPIATAHGPTSTAVSKIDSGRLFEAHARRVLSEWWGVPLRSAVIELAPGLSHQFDLVSLDGQIVGDAKWFKNLPVPAAKWSVIAEYVWLLQHITADRRFLVFGQDREVPERWLTRFRPLIGNVEFYFLGHDGDSVVRLA
jgi:hypothetical protein